jgi:hypothetical protein
MAFISFESPFGPDDRTVGREPPPGRDLADLVLRGVEAAGFRIPEPLAQHDSYGWSFTVETGGPQPVWCLLQLSDEWLLITHARRSLLQRLRGDVGMSADHAKLDAALVTTLSSIPHVSNVRWFRSEEDLREGHAGQP